jgi:hypothetical protein
MLTMDRRLGIIRPTECPKNIVDLRNKYICMHFKDTKRSRGFKEEKGCRLRFCLVELHVKAKIPSFSSSVREGERKEKISSIKLYHK